MPEEKKCKYCSMMIPSDASFCPHCRKRQGASPILIGIGTLFGLFLFMMILVGLMSNTSSPSVKIGEEAILDDGGERTLLTISKEADSKFRKAKIANDKYGMGAMLLTGQAYTVKSGVKVLVLDQGMYITQVRVLEGENIGTAGWTAMEHVKPIAP